MAAVKKKSKAPETDTSSKRSPSQQPLKKTIKIEFVRPHLYPKQLAAIYDEHRFALIEASTKAGKTLGCIVWLTERAVMGGGEGRNYWWVAPVSTQADIAYTRMIQYMPRDMYETNSTHKTITLINGAVIWCKGADRPDTLYGDDVHAAVIDEASRFKEDAWYAVRSTLTATRGPIRIIGNVKGRKNWFYSLARTAQKGHPDMGYHKITAYDAVEAGVLAVEEIEGVKSEIPEQVFRELYLAEPSDDGGNPFGLSHIFNCVRPLSALPPRVWGWDLGKKVDWTVGIALDVHGHVCRFERFQLPWPDAIKRILIVNERTPALVDSTGLGDPVVEMLQRETGSSFKPPVMGKVKPAGMQTVFQGYHFTSISKQKLMEGLAVAIQSGTIGYPDGEIVRELNNFEYEHTRIGVRYSAPEGMHDDCVCALALANIHKGHAIQPMYISDEVLARARQPVRFGMRLS